MHGVQARCLRESDLSYNRPITIAWASDKIGYDLNINVKCIYYGLATLEAEITVSVNQALEPHLRSTGTYSGNRKL